jgi:hypothetical protein
VKGRGREQGLAERPQVEHKKELRREMGEDDCQWLITDPYDDNGAFSFFFPHRHFASRAVPNRFIRLWF